MNSQGHAKPLSRWRALAGSIEAWAATAPLAFSLVAVAILMAGAYCLLRPSYDTNDDAFLSMIAAGKGFRITPDEHLVFTNILIGHALKRLYHAWPSVPWYGCYLLAVHYLSQVALLFVALKIDLTAVLGAASLSPLASNNQRSASMTSDRTRLRLLLYLVYFAVVELYLLNALQFTTTAFLAAQGGIVLFGLAWQGRERMTTVTVTLSAALCMLLLAAMIRLESLWMALMLAAPIGVWLMRTSSRRVLVPCTFAGVAAALLIYLAVAYDRSSYEHDPRWSGFSSYNQLRVKFNDYAWTSYSPRTAELFSTVGWTKNDHDMIAHWFFDDPEIYSEAKLRAVIDGYPWKAERTTWAYFGQVCRGMLRDRRVLAVLLVLPFFMTTIRLQSARRLVIGCLLMTVALVALLTWNTKVLPPRAYFPMFSFPLMIALLLSGSGETLQASGVALRSLFSWKGRPGWGRAILVMLVVGIVMGVQSQARRSMLVQRDRRLLQAFLAELQPTGSELYVCWEATMPFELLSPLDNLASWSRMPFVSLAWMQQTPLQEELKNSFAISNLAEALCNRKDLVLVASPTHRALFATYAKEHLHAEVEFVESVRVNEKLVAGQLRRGPLERATSLPSERTERNAQH